MTEPEKIRAFVNGTAVELSRGACVRDAVQSFDPALAAEVAAGGRRVTDSRGLPADLNAPLSSGTIIRVVAARAVTATDEEE